ncbi:cache domain-containing protein [Azospirillum thermophilum]|uniref:Single Cache domain-containing protein n=1 Tax=Azospirillum thermophilum TaxID=2202148 RepID=A0A2S2CPS8_9PROT|nr:cache domain-containing protein [Azospirillum thermophilum]AWK86486.1 hypothetical protein DEW08_09750 [Azospirillum thermophilum]
MARMSLSIVPLAAGLALVALPALADRSTPEQAKALATEAAAYLKEKGPAAAAAAFNDPKGAFVRKDLYVFVFDSKGHYVASGANPKLAGTDASGLKDAEGRPIVASMMEVTKASPSGVVEYVWLNRTSNKVEHKHSYVIREGEYLVGSGYYSD